jgi:hypothetical protein
MALLVMSLARIVICDYHLLIPSMKLQVRPDRKMEKGVLK